MLSIFGTTVQNIVYQITQDSNPPLYLTKQFLTVMIGILIFPLLIVKSIEKLKFVSLTAILAISTFTILVIYNFIVSYSENGLGEGYL